MMDIHVRTGKSWSRTEHGYKYIFKFVLTFLTINGWETVWYDDEGIEETKGHLYSNDGESNWDSKIKFDFEMSASYRKVSEEEMNKLDNFEICVGTVWVRKDEDPESAVYLRIIEVSDEGVIIETYDKDLISEGRIIVDTNKVSIRKFIIRNLYREIKDPERAKLLLEGKKFRL
jgi:hypothetical protein